MGMRLLDKLLAHLRHGSYHAQGEATDPQPEAAGYTVRCRQQVQSPPGKLHHTQQDFWVRNWIPSEDQ